MQITIALTKGRILKETLPLLAAAGLEPLEDISRSRKLIFPTNQQGVRLLILRGVDVPTYVQHGAADMGVAGKDTLLEHGADGIYEPLDLGIARCRLMTAGVKGVELPQGRIKVATKFVRSAKRYYAAQGRQADIIKLYGAMELAPLMDLADEIVDIVDTGNTLKANGLEPRDTIAHISSRLIVNKASMKMKYQPINALIEKLAAAAKKN
ncbi:ATP phosphoribosyltransferase [Microbulbifer thermotolerans]|uniref:ATP phosphoribosyltransferase n=1 Tax=Microbulbifer thermotolerans TaxID=252514 RepID=UPI0008F38E0B|nr:ATP phosphoribosyltransferase [Microbulbifer thermotolerans]MCX2783096.1 ATP phosphoribosyltransferase [Microbulbifer thermotolerans]MCX2794302.1 ATP phosphoribosyltransferase [Microbulbifer thermotolerans]MCX2834261.1 ATP phosphoribosyltransferase [Microbulbifer thermotolerans]WKT61584.1 ATP phosphoribosyltransferase [Microbulbifer thermotolerans]SFB69483.1 ATP phosphoribosyltransferase [Microbulbifer thermotolerans]